MPLKLKLRPLKWSGYHGEFSAITPFGAYSVFETGGGFYMQKPASTQAVKVGASLEDGVAAVMADIRQIIEDAIEPEDWLAEAEQRDWQLDAIVAPDNGSPTEVLEAVRQCAQAWVPDARILGNVRAGDIARAADAILATMEEAEVRDALDRIADQARRVLARHSQGTPLSSAMAGLADCVNIATHALNEDGSRVVPTSSSTENGERIAAAIEACDWSGSPIGNKEILKAAIAELRSLEAWQRGAISCREAEEARIAEYRIEAEAARRAPQHNVRVPEGWQLVPKEPTAFMISKGIGCDWRRGDDTIRNIWRHMLDSAPSRDIPVSEEICATCDDTGNEGRHSICRDCEEPRSLSPNVRVWTQKDAEGADIHKQILDYIQLAYDLSTWAACINWRGKENQKEWLDDLREKIEAVQTASTKIRAAVAHCSLSPQPNVTAEGESEFVRAMIDAGVYKPRTRGSSTNVEAVEIIREMVRLADMGFDESLREPEEKGNFAVYERAKRFLACQPSPKPRAL